MKKQIGLAAVMLFASGAVLAEWVKVATSNNAVEYLDPGTLRKSGQKIKSWGLIDHRAPQLFVDEKKYLSLKVQSEVDCGEESARTITMVMYGGNMGAGEVLWSGAPPDTRWTPVTPGTLSWTAMKNICKR